MRCHDKIQVKGVLEAVDPILEDLNLGDSTAKKLNSTQNELGRITLL